MGVLAVGRRCRAEPRRDAGSSTWACGTLPDGGRHRVRRDVLAVPRRGWRDQRRRLPPRAADSGIGRPRGRERGLPRRVADLADRAGLRRAPLPLHRRRPAQLPARRVLRRHVRLHDDGCQRRHRLRRDIEVARDVAPVHPVDRRHRHRRPCNRCSSEAESWGTPAARVGAAGTGDRPALGADPRPLICSGHSTSVSPRRSSSSSRASAGSVSTSASAATKRSRTRSGRCRRAGLDQPDSAASFAPASQWILGLFMLLAGMNYLLMYRAFVRRRPGRVVREESSGCTSGSSCSPRSR